MQEKKEGHTVNYTKKLPKKRSIEEYVKFFRRILSDVFLVSGSHTFLEAQQSIKGKKVSPQAKSMAIKLCDQFEQLEYRRAKPSDSEFTQLRKLLTELAKEFSTQKTKEEASFMGNILKNVGTAKKKKRSGSRKAVSTSISLKPKQAGRKKEKTVKGNPAKMSDSERKKIMRYAKTSKELGVATRVIKKELREMGFNDNNIDFVLKNL